MPLYKWTFGEWMVWAARQRGVGQTSSAGLVLSDTGGWALVSGLHGGAVMALEDQALVVTLISAGSRRKKCDGIKYQTTFVTFTRGYI